MLRIVIPIFNEADNLSELLKELSKWVEQGDKIIFVDDGSTDATQAWFKNNTSDQVMCLRLEKNAGPGAAFDCAFGYLLKHEVNKAIMVLTIEGDNTSNLDELPLMKQAIADGYDLALASVYMQGGKFEKTSLLRLLISQIANFMARKILGLRFHTLTSFYRIYTMQLLQKIDEHYPHFCEQKGFICKVELLCKSMACGAKVKEIPTILRSSRRKGNSKMRILPTSLAYLRFMINWKIKN
ncbi:MAG: glycosyltransferase [Flavobacteriales bacterium]